MTKIKYIATPDSVNDDIMIDDLVFERNGDAVEVPEDHPDHDMLVANPTFEVVKETAKTKKVKAEAKKASVEDDSKSELTKDSAVVKQTQDQISSGEAEKVQGE